MQRLYSEGMIGMSAGQGSPPSSSTAFKLMLHKVTNAPNSVALDKVIEQLDKAREQLHFAVDEDQCHPAAHRQ